MMTLHLMQTSYNELEILFRERRKEEIMLVNSSTLQSYVLSLHYMFVNEFCKLFENASKRAMNNVASLISWNRYLLNSYGSNFKDLFEENEQLIDEVKKSDIYNLVKTFRDTRFSHMDGERTNPFNVPFFEDIHLKELKNVLLIIKNIVNNCTRVDDNEIVYNDEDDRTNNFISYHAKYKEFYNKNVALAIEQGFELF
ncbi:MAG: hypothetical protein ACN6O7_20440 [Sphingobacterium sp.]